MTADTLTSSAAPNAKLAEQNSKNLRRGGTDLYRRWDATRSSPLFGSHVMPRRTPPVVTHGLTHLALAVRNPKKSLAFYHRVLGVVAVYRENDFIQAQTPGSRDVLVFEKNSRQAGRSGGVAHFGFRLKNAADIEIAIKAVKTAGGEIIEHGEFSPGEPYLFFRDPDGYEVEIWYELPTAVDPPNETIR